MLGVPGLMDVYRAGRVALANAPGTGIADDKVVYAYVPQIIRYYLKRGSPFCRTCRRTSAGTTPSATTCSRHIEELVVKPANESGGYGMLIGPRASREECDEFRRAHRRPTAELHRAADAQPVARPVVTERGLGGAARRLCGRSSSTATTSTCCPAD